MSIDKLLNERAGLISEQLVKYFPNDTLLQQTVIDAMKYSLCGGGKRIRPFLLTEAYSACGGKDINDIMNFACAVEMIHTYSLIHDDLPCMDDDDMRRGRPSCHIKFGEDMALLAGDALLTKAFDLIFNHTDFDKISYEKTVKAGGILAKSAGALGMVGGQVIDLQSENKVISYDTLHSLHLLKTGALIKASASMGAVLTGADDKTIDSICEYADCIGLAFQIIDDILDVTSTGEKLGKPIGSDSQEGKNTFVTLLGIDKSFAEAKRLTDKAIESVKDLNNNKNLIDFAAFLYNREA